MTRAVLSAFSLYLSYLLEVIHRYHVVHPVADLDAPRTRALRIRPLHGIDVQFGRMFRHGYRTYPPNLGVMLHHQQSWQSYLKTKTDPAKLVPLQSKHVSQNGKVEPMRSAVFIPCMSRASSFPMGKRNGNETDWNFWNDPAPR